MSMFSENETRRERNARGHGVKEVGFNHREVKIDDKSRSIIIPPYYTLLAYHLLLLSLAIGTHFMVGM